jgi:hypothetical protein
MKKNLLNICLVAIDGVGDKTNEINKVIDICCKNFNWKCVFNFSPINHNNFSDSNGNFILKYKIPQMSYFEYNKFCINGLYNLIKNFDFDYCLIIQEDGFIINPNLWDDCFLNYDYIGAPWLNHSNINTEEFWWLKSNSMKHRVGNGGFSLRSRKFLKESSCLEYLPDSTNEDVFLCAIHGDYLEKKGIKFANLQVASKFSLETDNDLCNDLNKTFGFHGKHLLENAFSIVNNRT